MRVLPSKVLWVYYEYHHAQYLHEGLVVGSNFLHMDVILAVHIWLCSAVSVGYSDNGSHILEVAVCVHFDLPQSTMGVSNLEDDGEASRTQLCNKRNETLVLHITHSTPCK
jgi:hypothetical protein